MRIKRWFTPASIGLGLVAAMACLSPGPGAAGVQDSVFLTNPDGNVSFDVRDVSRREVLDKLLAGKRIELEWADSAIGDEKISGAFKGSTESVLLRLLAQTDYVAVYDRDGGDVPRIARLIIVGKGSSKPGSAGSPNFIIASQPAAGGATPPAAAPADATALFKPFSGAADFTPPSAADQAATLIRPAPAGETAPPLVPPSAAELAKPLFVPPSGQKQ